MISIPTLAEVAADRAKLEGLPFDALWSLLLKAGELQTEIACGMLPAMHRAVTGAVIAEDRALTIEEAAERLKIAPATMQKWLRREPYNAAVAVRSRTCVRVSAQRLEQILLGRGAGPRRKAVSA